MPSEWRETTLGEVATVRSGFAFKNSDWVEEGVPVVKIGNVKDGRVVLDGCSYVAPEVAAEADEYRLRAGDILVAMTGYIGDVALVRDDSHIMLNQRVGRFEIKRADLLDPLFLFYFLRLPGTRSELEGRGYGSAQPNISPDLIHAIEMPLPPLREQRSIARILGALDDKIELNRKMNETLEQMCRAIFKSWFVDFDPVRAKAAVRRKHPKWTDEQVSRAACPELKPEIAALFPDSFVDSELGKIPKGWKVGKFGDVAEHQRRGVQVEDIEANTPYIALEHMPRRSITLSEWSAADGLASNKFRFKKGEILFGKLRPYFHKVGVAPVDGVCSTDIVVVTPRQPGWFGFVLCHASSVEFVEYTNAGSTGTKMPRTSWADMASYELVLPPETVAEAFSKRVQPSIDRVIASIHESRTLAALRDALLPKLMSGEVRAEA